MTGFNATLSGISFFRSSKSLPFPATTGQWSSGMTGSAGTIGDIVSGVTYTTERLHSLHTKNQVFDPVLVSLSGS